MPTFLMVGKLTKHNPDHADHVYPPSFSAVHSKSDDHLRQQTTALEVGIEQEVTVTRDSVSLSPYHPMLESLTWTK